MNTQILRPSSPLPVTPRRPPTVCGSLVATLAVLLSLPPLLAQPAPQPLQHFWRTDAAVNIIKVKDRTAYLGGTFSYVGPVSGSVGIVSPASGEVSDGFPQLDGIVRTALPDGTGGWFLGGNFTVRNLPGLRNLVRVNAERYVDPGFAPGPDKDVHALALVGDILVVAGEFDNIAGLKNTGKLVFLDRRTGASSGIRIGSSGIVRCLTTAGSRLYVGGAFSALTTFKGAQKSEARQRLAVIDTTTWDLLPWNPGATGGSQGVKAIAVSTTTVYAGGDFTLAGGKPRNRIAAINIDDGVANAWNPNPTASGSTVPEINALAIVGDNVYVGGEFVNIGSRARARLAAIPKEGNGQSIDAWQADCNDRVHSLFPLGDDLYVGGAFRTIAGTARAALARVSLASGSLADWGPRFSNLNTPNAAVPSVRALSLQDAEMAVAGEFPSIGGALRQNLAAIDLNSGRPTAWNPKASGEVLALEWIADHLVVGGTFTNVGGAARNRAAIVNLASGAATDWNPEIAGTAVRAIATAGSRVYLGGEFTAAGGQLRANFAELGLNDARATPFNPGPNRSVETLLLNPQGTHIYVGGLFQVIAGDSANDFLALLKIGDAKPVVSTFQARPNGAVRALALHDSRLFVAGDFTQIAGQPRNRAAAVHPDTGVEPSIWDAAVLGTANFSLRALLPVAKTLYLGGDLTSAGGELRARVGAVHVDAATATGWNPGANETVRTMAESGDLFLVGGEFTRLGLSGPNPSAAGGYAFGYFAAFRALPTVNNIRRNASGSPIFDLNDGHGTGSSVEVHASPTLVNPNWKVIATRPISGLQQPFEDPAGTGLNARYYRAVRVP